MVAIGNFLFHFRNALFPVAFLLVLLPGPVLFSDPLYAALVGFVVALAGQFVRASTIGLRYIIRGGKNRRVYAEDLVTEGIYSHSRNPMYVGNLLILGGVAIASNSWICVGIAVPLFLFIYCAIVAAEEAYLRGKFGQAFDAYVRDVPRWLLRFRGLGTTLAESEFHWRRVLVKEYGTPTGWVIGICASVLWDFWWDDVLDDRQGAVQGLIAAMIVVAVFWCVARFMKKSRTIVAD
ncbi:MAG TPA: isoprenylcysteine carboxylmethyltransferase family protein [Steroidobacteraceae bacterium]|nr:isoprenylcysteine carboxylmethyltransferase family protein [Steroidobacteraceae bacterium]